MIRKETKKRICSFALALILVVSGIVSASAYAETKDDVKDNANLLDLHFVGGLNSLNDTLGSVDVMQPVNNTQHITEVKFGVFPYGLDKEQKALNISSQTSNVYAGSFQLLYSNDNQTWIKENGKIKDGMKYRLKIAFYAKSGFDFDGLTKDKINLENVGPAIEYDANKKEATFEMPVLTRSVTLTFDTKGGSNIDPVEVTKDSEIDLSKYEPKKQGFYFVGWYTEPELTNRVKNIKLTEDKTLYAKWVPLPQEPTPPVNPNPEKPAPTPEPAPTPNPGIEQKPTPMPAPGENNGSENKPNPAENSANKELKIVTEGQNDSNTETNGNAIIYKIGTSSKAVFRIVGDDLKVKDLQSVLIDGQLVDPSNYNVKQGSIIVEFKKSYLDSLKSGKHNIIFNTAKGFAKAELEIKEKQNSDITSDANKKETVNTGDSSDFAGYSLLVIVGLGAAYYVSKRRRSILK